MMTKHRHVVRSLGERQVRSHYTHSTHTSINTGNQSIQVINP